MIINLKKQKVAASKPEPPQVFVAYMGQQAKDEAIRLVARLRRSGIGVVTALGDRSLKAQLKQANTAGAHQAVIIGEDEVKNQTVVLRDMEKGEQTTIPWDKVVGLLKRPKHEASNA